MTVSYTGEVAPGGPADLRDLPDVSIRKLSVSQMHNNCYLLTCKATGEQLLIDAADEAPRLLELVSEGGSGLATVVTTRASPEPPSATSCSSLGASSAASISSCSPVRAQVSR